MLSCSATRKYMAPSHDSKLLVNSNFWLVVQHKSHHPCDLNVPALFCPMLMNKLDDWCNFANNRVQSEFYQDSFMSPLY